MPEWPRELVTGVSLLPEVKLELDKLVVLVDAVVDVVTVVFAVVFEAEDRDVEEVDNVVEDVVSQNKTGLLAKEEDEDI